MAILSKIDEMFGDPEKINPENMGQVFHEMLSNFRELKAQLESKDEAVRNEALETISKLRLKLEEKASELCQSVGMDLASFETYVNDPTHFNREEWEAMEQTNSEVADFRKELEVIAQTETHIEQKKKPTVNNLKKSLDFA